MTPAPEDPNGLREALARALYEQDNPEPRFMWPPLKAFTAAAKYRARADALIDGLLAPYLAAEAEITRLKERMEARERALKPFADIADRMPAQSPLLPDWVTTVGPLTWGDLRRSLFSALATLSPKEHPHG